MKIVTINNRSVPLNQPISAGYCTSFWSKFRGLMLQPSLEEGRGIILVESHDSRVSTTIHMLFMRFDIAAIWLNSRFEVVDVKVAQRWKLAISPQVPASYVIETRVNYAGSFHLGDIISFEYD